jgi:predicted NBD/HSP70 family sugar kinase
MSLAGTNLEYARSYNRRVVLEAVRLHGPLSRAEIARLTALTPQTISNIAQELEHAGLVRATGRRRAATGQPPIELAINAEIAYTIGFQLDHRILVGVLVNFAGVIVGQIDVAVDAPRPDEAVALMVRGVDQLVAAGGIARKEVWGVGVVMPGPFDVEGLTSVGPTTLPGWEGFPLERHLADLLSLPVLVENDATAAAIGERLYGAAKHLGHFFYVFIGMGLGGGMMLDGQPYRGAWGNAGELGHVTVAPGGAACFCGNSGCLERYVSLHSAYEFLRAAGRSADTPAALDALAQQSDPALVAWIASAAMHLRTALLTIENLLDPQTILLGGYLPPAVLDRLIVALEPLSPSISRQARRPQARVMRATAGRHAAALGAAALPMFDTINPSFSMLLKPGTDARSAAALLQRN